MSDNQELLSLIQTLTPPDLYTRIKCIIDYNHIGGKRTRSDLFNRVLMEFTHSVNVPLSDCIELLQTALLIMDDVMDNSTMRRNKMCWYLVNGLKASYDGNFIISVIYKIIMSTITDEYIRYKIIDFLNEIIFMTCTGQCQDVLSRWMCSWRDVESEINRRNYENICYLKTSLYTFYLPIKLGYICTGKDEPANLKELCKLFGLHYQTYDDYLDFYPNKSGKRGSDIEDRKLTWMMCRIVSDGFDQQVLDYFNGKYTSQMKFKAFEYSRFCDDEISMICKNIEDLNCDELRYLINHFNVLTEKYVK